MPEYVTTLPSKLTVASSVATSVISPKILRVNPSGTVILAFSGAAVSSSIVPSLLLTNVKVLLPICIAVPIKSLTKDSPCLSTLIAEEL